MDVAWAKYVQNSLKKPSTGLNPFERLLAYQPPLFPWSAVMLTSIYKGLCDVRRSRRIVITGSSQISILCCGCLPGISGSPFPAESPWYIGPFRIFQQINPVSYKLQLPAHCLISSVFLVSLLKPPGTGGHRTTEDPTPPPDCLPGQHLIWLPLKGPTYVVHGHLEGLREQSWVSAKVILDSPLITDFHANQLDRPKHPLGGGLRRLGSLISATTPATPSSCHIREPSPEF